VLFAPMAFFSRKMQAQLQFPSNLPEVI